MKRPNHIRVRTARWLRAQLRPSIIFLSVFALFCVWYYEGNNFGDGDIPATYIAVGSNGSNVLTINSDHTYEQNVMAREERKHASGIWRLGGNVDAHIVFEGSFIDAPSAATGQDDHYAFGMFDNFFGYLTLTLQSDTTPLEFHKKHPFF